MYIYFAKIFENIKILILILTNFSKELCERIN